MLHRFREREGEVLDLPSFYVVETTERGASVRQFWSEAEGPLVFSDRDEAEYTAQRFAPSTARVVQVGLAEVG